MPKREVPLGNITGPQGPKGDFLFTFEVDANGDLWAVYADGMTPPNFEYEATTGDLYLVVDD